MGIMERKGFNRYLSGVDVWALSLGCIIGWGCFVMPGTTFLPVAGPAGTVIAMAFSAAIMLVIGANYAYLMRKHPGIGGVYAYTKGAFGRDHAFISAWFLCLAYLSLIPQNATALTMVGRTVFGNALQRGATTSWQGMRSTWRRSPSLLPCWLWWPSWPSSASGCCR